MDLSKALTFNVSFGGGFGTDAATIPMFGKMGSLTDMVATVTNAPLGYDYGYCIQVAEGICYGDLTGRLVLIPAVQWAYQTGRYRSGLHAAVPITDGGGDDFFTAQEWAETITAALQARLFHPIR